MTLRYFPLFFVFFLFSCRSRLIDSKISGDPAQSEMTERVVQLVSRYDFFSQSLEAALAKFPNKQLIVQGLLITHIVGEISIGQLPSTSLEPQFLFSILPVLEDTISENSAIEEYSQHFNKTMTNLPNSTPMFSMTLRTSVDGQRIWQLGQGYLDFLSGSEPSLTESFDQSFDYLSHDFQPPDRSDAMQWLFLNSYRDFGRDKDLVALRRVTGGFSTSSEPYEFNKNTFSRNAAESLEFVKVKNYERFYRILLKNDLVRYIDEDLKSRTLPPPLSTLQAQSSMNDKNYVKVVSRKKMQVNGIENPFLQHIGKRLSELPNDLRKLFSYSYDGDVVLFHRTKTRQSFKEIRSGNVFTSVGQESSFGGHASWGNGFYLAPTLELTQYGPWVVPFKVDRNAVIGHAIDLWFGAKDGLIVVLKQGGAIRGESFDLDYVEAKIEEAIRKERPDLILHLIESAEIDFKDLRALKTAENLHPIVQLYLLERQYDAKGEKLEDIPKVVTDFFTILLKSPERATLAERASLDALLQFSDGQDKAFWSLEYFTKFRQQNRAMLDIKLMGKHLVRRVNALTRMLGLSAPQSVIDDDMKLTVSRLDEMIGLLTDSLMNESYAWVHRVHLVSEATATLLNFEKTFPSKVSEDFQKKVREKYDGIADLVREFFELLYASPDWPDTMVDIWFNRENIFRKDFVTAFHLENQLKPKILNSTELIRPIGQLMAYFSKSFELPRRSSSQSIDNFSRLIQEVDQDGRHSRRLANSGFERLSERQKHAVMRVLMKCHEDELRHSQQTRELFYKDIQSSFKVSREAFTPQNDYFQRDVCSELQAILKN